MNSTKPEMNYDAHDAAYLFSNMLNLYRQAPEEVTGEHTSDMDVMGLMWASAADAAAALNVEVDFSAGWDGVFAYEELDHDADGSLAHSIFENCIASSAMTVEDVVRAHAVKEGWPLNRPEAAPDAAPQIGTPEAAPEAVPAQPRVLIIVSGGVADYVCDTGIDVVVFDWDNHNEDPENTGGVPAHFIDLATPNDIPVDDLN